MLRFVFILLSVSMFSQNSTLKGKVISKSVEGFAINIYNLNQQKGTINDADGNFKIAAKINDTIVFSSIQHQELRIIIKASHLVEKQLQINLEDKLHRLSEVIVSKSGLTGDLTKDLDKIPLKKSYGNELFGLPVLNIKPLTLPERSLRTLQTGHVDLIVNSLNGKIKKMKRAVAMERKNAIIEKASKMFAKGVLSKKLGLPEEEVKQFLFYCLEKDVSMKELVNENKGLELLKFLKHKAVIEFRVEK